MYLDTKIKLIPLVELVKSKFKNFHTRVCLLVVIVNISATTGPARKKIFCRLISTPGSRGIARIFDWEGPNHKSHAMTSSEIFPTGTFDGATIS